MKVNTIPRDRSITFLDANKKSLMVNKIEKVPYSGKIYDVTVPNHILFICRNGKTVWSGNCGDDGSFTPTNQG